MRSSSTAIACKPVSTGDRVKLLTRKGLDWTAKFSGIAQSLRALKLGSALIDGEVVVEDEAGVSSFTGLQEALKSGRSDRMVFYAFDLLYLDGYDLTRVPLIDRKILLAGCLDDVPAHGAVRYSEHIERSGAAMVRHACRLGLEGIVSKRKDLPYRAGRGPHWLKIKCMQRQEFVIAGYVPSTTSARRSVAWFWALHEGGRLVHVGRVGTGFTEAVARDLWTALEALKRSDPPFAQKLPAEAARGVRWVEPKLVAEVELRGWTTDGLLRHASFKGLRDDKDAAEVVREAAARSSGKAALRPTTPTISRLTHPDRVLWPDVGTHQAGLGGVLRRHRRMGSSAPCRPAIVARALPIGCGERLLLPEARLGGHRIGDRPAHGPGRGGALHRATLKAWSPLCRPACSRSTPGGRRSAIPNGLTGSRSTSTLGRMWPGPR